MLGRCQSQSTSRSRPARAPASAEQEGPGAPLEHLGQPGAAHDPLQACGVQRAEEHAHCGVLRLGGLAACAGAEFQDAASYGPGAVHMRAALGDTRRL